MYNSHVPEIAMYAVRSVVHRFHSKFAFEYSPKRTAVEVHGETPSFDPRPRCSSIHQTQLDANKGSIHVRTPWRCSKVAT